MEINKQLERFGFYFLRRDEIRGKKIGSVPVSTAECDDEEANERQRDGSQNGCQNNHHFLILQMVDATSDDVVDGRRLIFWIDYV